METITLSTCIIIKKKIYFNYAKCLRNILLNTLLYILSPIILVRKPIRDMLRGGTGKIIFGRIKYILSKNLGFLSNKNSSMCKFFGTLRGCGLSRLLIL